MARTLARVIIVLAILAVAAAAALGLDGRDTFAGWDSPAPAQWPWESDR